MQLPYRVKPITGQPPKWRKILLTGKFAFELRDLLHVVLHLR